MRLALYLRRSTDEIQQADSIAAQHALLRQWATERHHEIWDDVFEDSASGRTADRPGFQRLVALISAGAPFEGVLVRDVSRLGRFLNIDEAAFWEFLFLSRGVRVFYAQESFREDGDPFSPIQKALRRFAAAEFSREKGRLMQYGKYRTVCRGFWKGGAPPYGYVRVLLAKDNSVMRTLKDGERKIICAERVSLRPASDGSADTVKRIFRMYVQHGMTPHEIANKLTRERMRSPRGGVRWYWGSISKMLGNPAYAGLAAARFEKSENFPEPLEVKVSAEWPPLVSAAIWKRAESRRAIRTRASTSPAREEKLRSFFAAHGEFGLRYRSGHVPQWLMSDGTSTDNAEHIVTLASVATEETIAALQAAFALDRDGKTVLLGKALRVGFSVSLPRGHVLGGVQWRFDFDGSEPQDVTVGIGLGADLRPAAYFVFVNMRWTRKARRMAPLLAPGRFATILPRTWPEVIQSLRSNVLRYSSLTREQFLRAIDGRRSVNTYAIGRELGWHGATVKAMYRRIAAEGVELPPLSKKVQPRITLICDDCGKKRTCNLSQSRCYSSGLCRACFDQRRASPNYCSSCGFRRAVAEERASKYTRRLCEVCKAKGGVERSRMRLCKIGKPYQFAPGQDTQQPLARVEPSRGGKAGARRSARRSVRK
jgi:DNA invertase Pin-like site-specific DNA recombinase